MALVLGNGLKKDAATRTPYLHHADNNWMSLDLFGTLSKRTGRKACATLRPTSRAKVTVAFHNPTKQMALVLGDGLETNAATRTPYLHHADNNWMSLDLFGTLSKRTGRKASAI